MERLLVRYSWAQGNCKFPYDEKEVMLVRQRAQELIQGMMSPDVFNWLYERVCAKWVSPSAFLCWRTSADGWVYRRFGSGRYGSLTIRLRVVLSRWRSST